MLRARAPKARLHAFTQLLKRYVERRYQEDPDRACGKHAAEHSGTNSPAADLSGACGNYQRQQTENEGDRSHHHSAEPHLRTEYRCVLDRDAALALFLSELDNQDAVLGRQRNQHYESNLTV